MIDNHSHSQSQWRRSRSGGFPKTMYVCICNGVTDSDIRQAAKAGCGGLAELTMRTGCGACCGSCVDTARSEEHTSEIQSLMRISYAVFCLKKKIKLIIITAMHPYNCKKYINTTKNNNNTR